MCKNCSDQSHSLYKVTYQNTFCFDLWVDFASVKLLVLFPPLTEDESPKSNLTLKLLSH